MSFDPPGSSADTLSSATRNILHLMDEENIETASANATRVWYIIYQQSIDELISQSLHTHPDPDYLNNNFTLTSTEILNDLGFSFTRGEHLEI